MESARLIQILKKIIVVSIKCFVGLVIFIFLAICIFKWWASTGTFSTSKYDPEAWFKKQTNESVTSCYRGSMAFDIRDNLLVKGMSKEKVFSLLGEPDSSNESEYQYVLGMCSGLRIDFDVLHVYFKDGALANAEVYQH